MKRRKGIPDDDEVAQIPVAAGQGQPRHPYLRRLETTPAAGARDHPQSERYYRDDNRELGGECQPARHGRQSSRRCLPAAIEKQSDARHEQCNAGEIVRRAPAVENDEQGRRQEDPHSGERRRGELPLRVSAPSCEQREAQPAEVHDGREEIASKCEHADGMRELGVYGMKCRIDAGEREVQRGHATGLEKARREWQVIVERVIAQDPCPQCAECACEPRDRNDEGQSERDPEPLSASRRLINAADISARRFVALRAAAANECHREDGEQ